MRRSLILFIVLLVAACGGSNDDGETPTPTTSPNDATATTTTRPSATPAPTEVPIPPELSVEVAASAVNVVLNQPVTATMTVANAGTVRARDVTLEATLTGDFTLTSIETTGGECSAEQSITCHLGEIEGMTSVTVVVSLTPTRSGSLTIDAAVVMVEPDATADNERATAEIAVTYAGYTPPARTIQVASVGTLGVNGNGESCCPSLSGDGRYVAFVSRASNLAAGATEGNANVYVYDRFAFTVALISGSADNPANGDSATPVISADGRYVAFSSAASNLDDADNNEDDDVFLFDRQTGGLSLVSRGRNGSGNALSIQPAISGDGRYVAFTSGASDMVTGDTNQRPDVFVFDRDTGQVDLVSAGLDGDPADDGSDQPAISGDGGVIAFRSEASNLVEDDDNSQSDIFALDLATGTIKIVSLAADGSGGNDASLHPAVSADGTTIAFESRASNLVENDTNETVDIFVRAGDGVVERVSTTPEGIQSEGACRRPRISADGRYVVFLSRGQNLVVPDSNGQYDVFIRDRVDNTLSRVPIAVLPEEGNDNILRVAISDDTMIIAYASPSPDIAPNDENDVADIFVQRR